MAPKYKLTYFDIKGLGECIKYILEYKRIPYELETIKFFYGEDKWFDVKPSMPFGQLPILDVDGKRLYQSQSICKYLADLYDLNLNDPWEDAQISAIASTYLDLLIRAARFYYEKDEEMKKKYEIECVTTIMPFYLERFEKILMSKGDFFGGKKLSWVDFFMLGGLETLAGMFKENPIVGKYPELEKFMNRVWSLPNIKEYIKRRPPYPR